jgi:cysteine desulfurase
MTGVQSRSYLDHAATTPMLPAARERWLQASEQLGNPSSLHTAGRGTRRIVEESRERIAADLGTRPSSVIFTSGGTESDNLAIKGLFWARTDALGEPATIIASGIEHHAVLDPVEWLQKHQAAPVHWLAVDAAGRVDLADLDRALTAGQVALCSVMWANNEIGTVQPVAEIAARCREAGVPFHTDAVQALGQVPLDLAAVGASAVTLSSHKVGGPFGVGALVLDPAVPLTPVLHGGGQERDIRSGTLDAPAIAAFAEAVHHAVEHQRLHAEQVRVLRNALVAGVRASVPDAVLNGSNDLDGDGRLPGNAHFSFPGCEGDALLMLLDAAGVDCSTGSACTAGIPEPSHVLLALGVDEQTARGSLRFSLGRTSTRDDVDRVLAALPAAVERAARAGGARRRA